MSKSSKKVSGADISDTMDASNDIDEKMEELEGLRDWFMGEEFRLGEAMEKYKEAMGLQKEISEALGKMENGIEVLDEEDGRK